MTALQMLAELYIIRDRGAVIIGPPVAEIQKLQYECKLPDDWPSEAVLEGARATAMMTMRAHWQKLDASRKLTPVTPVAEPDVPRETDWESRIKVMKYGELDALCAANNVPFQREGGNPGIRCMRARNALYSALRKGVRLQAPGTEG